MNIRFVPDGPALFIHNRQRVLVAADLHIGIETELAARGWHVASRTRERLERLVSCIDQTRPDLLLLLGDVKHNLPQATRQEYRELPEFLSALRSRVPIQVMPGNHDTYISRFLEQDEILDKSGVVLDGTGYIHGHTIPSAGLKDQLIVTGHHHPMIAIRDEVGCALRSPAYLLATLSPDILFKARNTGGKRGRAAGNRGILRALLMPAFNECSGYDVSRIIRHPFSPISRAIVRESAEVLLTDGTYIGPAALLEEPDGAA